jgi:ElaB/YqjD/DUF883 family membrane-anchored ribosome-binding protein
MSANAQQAAAAPQDNRSTFNQHGIPIHMTNEKLTRDLRAVVTDAEDLLKATAGQAGERVEKARARAEESLNLARASLQNAGSQLNEQVRQNPWTAIGVAAGAALVLGILLGRK